MYEAVEGHAGIAVGGGDGREQLPAYEEGIPQERALGGQDAGSEQGRFAENARDEKERLQRHLSDEDAEVGRDQAVFSGVSADISPQVSMGDKNKGKERKKSMTKVGDFFGRAFTGYGTKTESQNRW